MKSKTHSTGLKPHERALRVIRKKHQRGAPRFYFNEKIDDSLATKPLNPQTYPKVYQEGKGFFYLSPRYINGYNGDTQTPLDALKKFITDYPEKGKTVMYLILDEETEDNTNPPGEEEHWITLHDVYIFEINCQKLSGTV